jgi:hypothetical protein
MDDDKRGKLKGRNVWSLFGRDLDCGVLGKGWIWMQCARNLRFSIEG